MKSLLFLLLPILLLSSCITVQKSAVTVIEYPEAKTNENEAIEVKRIELTDETTILHVEVYNSPGYWVGISSQTVLKDREGRTYKLLSSNGFRLDSRVPMPRSGKKAFALYFEPVKKDVKEVDYIEGNNEGDFRIYGIKLYDEIYKADNKQ